MEKTYYMKTKYFFTGAMMVLMAASCTDLDVDIKATYTEFPESPIAAEAKAFDAYFAFRGAIGRRYDELVSMNSDEYSGISFDGDYLNSRDCSNLSLHMADPSACAAQLDVFSDLTAGITKCNTLIKEIGGNDSELAAPLRAVRAFYHFILMDNWGDTPIIDHIPGDGEAFDRSPRAQVAQWIESELLAVRNNCPAEVNATTYGTPTRWMANALLAKLYINWPVYANDVTSASWSYGNNPKLADCVAACDEIIKSNKFDLSDDFKKKFMYDNGWKIKDFIYAMPFDAVSAQGMTYARFRTWRQGQKDNGFYSIPMTNSVGGNFALNPEYVDLFNLPGDRRNDCIAGDASKEVFEVYQYNAITGEPTTVRNLYKTTPMVFYKHITLKTQDADLNCGKDMTGWGQGYKSIKFFPFIDEYNSYSRNQSNDVPIFRYADILLTKAEAITRGASATNGDTAESLFNQVRTAANAPAINGNPSLQEILDERGREFLDEHWRRNDLIRFNDFERDWGLKNIINPDAKTNYKMRLLPLSINVLNSNTNWKQNAGY